MIENPTPQQSRAIHLVGPNVIVSAAAGSGKTAVLIERAVSMMQNGMDADALLMLTFTNAAAVQMRTRILQELLERCACQSDAHLLEQADLIESADICTIDSFCLKLVRQYFHLVDVDPLFSIADAKEQAVLRSQAINELFDACFDASEQPFLNTLEALSDNSEETLKRRILQIYEYARTSADPKGWLEHAVRMYQGNEETTSFLQQEIDAFPPRLECASVLCNKAAQYVEDNRSPGKPVSMTSALLNCAQTFFELSRMSFSEAFGERLRSISLPARNARNARMEKKAFAPVSKMIDEVRDILCEILEHPLVLYGQDAAQSALLAMAEPTRELQRLVLAFERLYENKKSEKNTLDFADVEHLALRILQSDKVRSSLQKRYTCVFVDEYQDTNDLQEALITSLAKPGSLFCVGDVKQSIYAFRHAEPALFLRRYQRSAQDGPDCEQNKDVRLDLNTNFRSAKTILHFVNDVFLRTMRRDHGGVDYADGHSLSPGLEEQGSAVCVRLIQKPDHSDDEEILFGEVERQALACAQRIRELVDQRFFDGKTTRNYRFDDIAILLRRLKGIGPDFVSTLMAAGIPVISNVSSDVLSAQETGAMLCLLKVVDNARDDVSMLSALRSPAALLSATDLASIRAHDKSLPFALAARSFAKSGEGESADKIRAFFERLEQYRQLSVRVRVDKLLSHIYQDTNALAYYALFADGDQKVENLQALWLQAQTFASLDDGSLYGFLQQLKLHSELGVSEVATAPGGSNSVRVMTIHGAKGLEFPAVILPFLNQKLDQGTHSLQMTREQGIGLNCYHKPTQTRQKSAVQFAVERNHAMVERDEQLRLLYVALTRAQRDLTLIAEGDMERWMQQAQLVPQKATSFLGWMLPTLQSHPDCTILHDQEVPFLPSRYHIDLSLIQEQALTPLLFVEQYAQEASRFSEEEDLLYVEQRLNYCYPYRDEIKAPGKISVSQLNTHTAMPFEPLAIPSINTGALDAAAIGTAVHRAMLKLDFNDVAICDRIDSQLDGMLEKGLLTEAEREAVKPEVLFAFFKTDLGKRLLQSPRILREQPFVQRIPALVYDDAMDPNAVTALQGIIDCAFLENGQWVLLDYKTNKLPQGGLEALRQTYQVQMDAYRNALEQLTNIPVMQCYLCFLVLNTALEIRSGELYEKLQANRD